MSSTPCVPSHLKSIWSETSAELCLIPHNPDIRRVITTGVDLPLTAQRAKREFYLGYSLKFVQYLQKSDYLPQRRQIQSALAFFNKHWFLFNRLRLLGNPLDLIIGRKLDKEISFACSLGQGDVIQAKCFCGSFFKV